MANFNTAKEWVDLSNLLESLKRSFTNFPESLVPRKKDLAKRLSQCLTPELVMIHRQTLEVYEEVFKRELYLFDRVHGTTCLEDDEDGNAVVSRKPLLAVFGEDMGLFISNLYNFY